MFKKFTLRLIVFSVIMALTGMLFQWLLPEYASVAIPFIILFFFFITLFTLFTVLRKEKQVSNKQFIFGYMLSRILKLTTMLLFLMLYMIFNPEDRWNFTGAFLIIYFSYSVFEFFALKKKNEKPL